MFKCHNVPSQIKTDLKKFLSDLENNGTFLLKVKKAKPLQSFEVNFLSEKEIQDLNKQFRDKEYTTDVLSFNLQIVGEIDLCVDVIKVNAIALNVSFLEELFRCIIHGSLHICGYDHEEKLTKDSLSKEPMFLIQEKILSQCHIK